MPQVCGSGVARSRSRSARSSQQPHRAAKIPVVLLGESSAGKTSLVHRFVANNFRLQQESNMAASLSERTVFVAEGGATLLELWDTPGVDSLRHLAPMYYCAADVAIVVFDVTSAQSYEIMKGWVDELKSLGPAGIRILIAANKSDRTDRREVPALEAQQYAAEVNALVFEVSALNGKGVHALFVETTKEKA